MGGEETATRGKTRFLVSQEIPWEDLVHVHNTRKQLDKWPLSSVSSGHAENQPTPGTFASGCGGYNKEEVWELREK